MSCARAFARTTALLALLGLACGPAGEVEQPAKAAPAASDATVEERTRAVREMFHLLGMVPSAGQWSLIAVANMNQFQEAVDAATLEKLREAASEAYAPGFLLDEMVVHYVENFDPDAARALIAYFQSPLGALVKEAAAKQGKTQAAEYETFVTALVANPPSEARLQLADRVAAATRQSDQAVATLVGISTTNLNAVIPLLPGTPSAVVIEARTAEVRDELVPRAQQQATFSTLYTFQELSDDQLRSHVEFLESGYYRWYVDQLLPATERALAAVGQKLADSVEAIAQAG